MSEQPVHRVLAIRVSRLQISAALSTLHPPHLRPWAKSAGLDWWTENADASGFTTAEEFASFCLDIAAKIRDHIDQVVVGVPGPVVRNDVRFCPAIPFLSGSVLSQALNVMGTHVAIHNNTTLLTHALTIKPIRVWRKDHGPHGDTLLSIVPRNAMVVSVGTGTGGAIIANGKVLLSERGLTGEIGHIRVPFQDKACTCGDLGCLETLTSSMSLVNLAHQAGFIGVVQATDILNHPELSDLVTTAIHALAQVIVPIICALDLDMVLLNGKLRQIFDAQTVETVLDFYLPKYKDGGVRVYHVNQPRVREGVLLGAAALGHALHGIV